MGVSVIKIKGKNRLEGVTIAQVDENRKPIPGTEIEYDCDTLLLSVGPVNLTGRSGLRQNFLNRLSTILCYFFGSLDLA